MDERLRNIRLDIAYDGTDFCGWQRQPGRLSVQASLERALKNVLGAGVRLVGSGRTDAGVHATNQVANFSTESVIPLENLQKALNNLLPPAVRITKVEAAAPHFHARHSAQAKTYRYRILQAPVCPPHLSRFVFHYPFALDRVRMAQAARCLEGEHDFTSFAAAPGRRLNLNQARLVGAGIAPPNPAPGRRLDANQAGGSPPELRNSAVRRIFSARILWRPRTSILSLEIRGNGFLHHMVRNIAGTLIEIGRGKIPPEEISTILEARDRRFAGPTAPAQGLCLVRVEYEENRVQG
ncbi:MAG: tRNA pseudouridine synthase A [Terriglobia bacterium]